VVFNAITQGRGGHRTRLKHPRQIEGARWSIYGGRALIIWLLHASRCCGAKCRGARFRRRVQSVACGWYATANSDREIYPARIWGGSLVATLTGRGVPTPFEGGWSGPTAEDFSGLDIGTGAGPAFKTAIEAANFRSPRRSQARAPAIAGASHVDAAAEASRKMGFAPAASMRIAQRLYEGMNSGGRPPVH